MKKNTSFLIKSVIILIAAVAISASASQPAAPAPFIKGELQIRYHTRTQQEGGKPKIGVTDSYTYRVNVSNSALFKGTIEHKPFVKRTLGANQTGQLLHDVQLDVVNPANPNQTRNVGKLYGTVPIDEKNVYRFSDGTLKVSVFDMGAARGFESAAKGLALGKPPADTSILGRAKAATMTIQRQVRGQTVAIQVSKYDEMVFQNHVLVAGPVRFYNEATVNGKAVYDYGRSAWHFVGLTITYPVDGRLMTDNISGSVRWVEAPNRKVSGEGAYEFDIRFNEVASANEGSIFAAPADESAFFATDTTIPSLVGQMKYKDAIANDVVNSSAVTIDLVGNGLTKVQVMNLAKLLLFSFIVPLNAE